MASYFLDSSAAVKLYVREAGTEWLAGLAGAGTGHSLFMVRVSIAEIAAALYRRVQGGTLTRETAFDQVALLKQHATDLYQLLEVTPELVELSVSIAEGHALRGYDCVQLAAATLLNRADRRGTGASGLGQRGHRAERCGQRRRSARGESERLHGCGALNGAS